MQEVSHNILIDESPFSGIFDDGALRHRLSLSIAMRRLAWSYMPVASFTLAAVNSWIMRVMIDITQWRKTRWADKFRVSASLIIYR